MLGQNASVSVAWSPDSRLQSDANEWVINNTFLQPKIVDWFCAQVFNHRLQASVLWDEID